MGTALKDSVVDVGISLVRMRFPEPIHEKMHVFNVFFYTRVIVVKGLETCTNIQFLVPRNAVQARISSKMVKKGEFIIEGIHFCTHIRKWSLLLSSYC